MGTPLKTSTLRELAASPAGAAGHWDVIVIGAGIAGGATALGMATRMGGKARVLLLERSSWPRKKVCGCCLNHAAVQTLAGLGVLGRIRAAGAERIDRIELRCARVSQLLEQPEGFAIDRAVLDSILVEAAIARGVAFMAESSALVQPMIGPAAEGAEREVAVRTREGTQRHRARLVVVADGLGGASLAELPEFRVEVRPRSWMGASAMVVGEPFMPLGVVQMNVGRGGYVGVVRLDERTTNIGASLDPRWTKSLGGPGPAVSAVLEECRAVGAADAARGCRWMGTPLLTRRRRRVAAPGVMVVGDAAGYVEPFTGEGMMWALASAEAASALAEESLMDGARGAAAGLAREWERWNAGSIVRRQRVCGVIRSAVHRPGVFSAAVRLMNVFPQMRRVGGRVCGSLSAPVDGLKVAGVSA